MASAVVANALRDAYRLALSEGSVSLLGYLRHVVIDSRPEPRAFGLVADPWQVALARKVVPAIERAVGIRPGYEGPRFFWFTMSRGHDKTGLIGRLCNGALAFCRRQVSLAAAAGDRDQADFLAQSMKAEARLNPWLDERVKFHNWKVLGQHDSKLWVLPADANSSFGAKQDLIVCDELTHWAKSDLFFALLSGIEKRPDSVVVIITNAGLLRSWQHEVLLRAKTDPQWFVYEAPGPIASWMNGDRVKAMAKKLPRTLADRVIWNRWQDPSEGCGYVTRAEAERCEELGAKAGLSYRVSGEPGVKYFAAVDYGPAKDRTALALVHRDDAGRVILDRLDVMIGTAKERVPIELVERWMVGVQQGFGRSYPVHFTVDEYQMEATVQAFQAKGFEVERFKSRSGAGNYEMAVNLHSLIVNCNLLLYPNAGGIVEAGGERAHTLVDELSELVLRPMVYGYRFDHTKTKHDDRVVAVGMAALSAVTAQTLPGFRMSDLYF